MKGYNRKELPRHGSLYYGPFVEEGNTLRKEHVGGGENSICWVR